MQQSFNNAIFIEQNTANAQKTFKPSLCHILEKQSKQNYIMFAVDDIVVCDTIDVENCIKWLEQTDAIGFYLRLGRNITKCYSLGLEHISLPRFTNKAPNVLQWQFKGNQGDWNYPHTVDMTVYKKSYVLPKLQALEYKAPNSLEGCWASIKIDNNASGLCYEHSKIVNIPLNLTQTECSNNHMGLLSTDDLLKLFQKNLKMNINVPEIKHNKSPHMEYVPSFILRN